MIKNNRTFFFVFATCLLLGLFAYFYSTYSGFVNLLEPHSVVEYQNPPLASHPSEVDPVTKESLKMSMFCYGFSGECQFNDLGLRLKLKFEGWSHEFPSYHFLNLWGGNTGWIFNLRYFGRRTLTIEQTTFQNSKNPTNKVLGKFQQKLWNRSAYDDFSQIIRFDRSKKKIFVAIHSGLFTEGQPVYEVGFD